MQEMWVWSLGWEDPLEEEMATHSSIFTWEIPWTEESGRPQSMGSSRDTLSYWACTGSMLWGKKGGKDDSDILACAKRGCHWLRYRSLEKFAEVGGHPKDLFGTCEVGVVYQLAKGQIEQAVAYTGLNDRGAGDLLMEPSVPVWWWDLGRWLRAPKRWLSLEKRESPQEE